MDAVRTPRPARRTVLVAGAGAAALAVCPRAASAAAAVTTAPAADLPLRTDKTTQGDILAGSRKDHACFLLLHFRDAGPARRWLARLLPELSTTEEMARFNALFSAGQAQGGRP